MWVRYEYYIHYIFWITIPCVMTNCSLHRLGKLTKPYEIVACGRKVTRAHILMFFVTTVSSTTHHAMRDSLLFSFVIITFKLCYFFTITYLVLVSFIVFHYLFSIKYKVNIVKTGLSFYLSQACVQTGVQ